MSFVIALAGVPGSGKSTLIRALAARLGGAPTLLFDDFRSSADYPKDLGAWMAEGADPNRWRNPALTQALRRLREETPGYLVLEEPFGRLRGEVAPLIDFVVCVDTPLDVALARCVLRDVERLRDSPKGELEDFLEGSLDYYLTAGHAFYPITMRSVRQNCELVVDGLLPTDQLAEQVVAAVTRARGA